MWTLTVLRESTPSLNPLLYQFKPDWAQTAKLRAGFEGSLDPHEVLWHATRRTRVAIHSFSKKSIKSTA